jgi:hypothetical protein
MTQEKLDQLYDQVLDDYFRALGKVAHSWNHLQEALGVLLSRAMRLPLKKALALWYSSTNDRAQREMIRSGLEVCELTADQKIDVTWLLNQVDKLSTQRNIAIHAPCSVGYINDSALPVQQRMIVGPHFFNGHPRAADLIGKDIIEEFKLNEQRTAALQNYASAIAASLREDKPRPWPERPRLPERTQATMSLFAKRQGQAKKTRR